MTPRRLLAGLAPLLLAQWPSQALPAGDRLSLTVDGPLRCMSASGLRRALEERIGPGAVDVGPQRRGEPSLVVRFDGPHLLAISLFDDASGQSMRRTFAVKPADCDELPATVALLVNAWLQHLPWQGGGPLPPVQHPAQRLASSDAPDGGPGADAGPPQPAERARLPEPIQRGTGRPAAAPAAGEPRAGPPVRLSGMLTGGGDLGLGTRLTPLAGGVSVEVGFGRRWGLGLSGEAESRLSAAAGEGRVLASAQRLALFARLSLRAPDRMGVDLLAAAGIDRTAARSAGYPVDGSTTLFDPQLSVGVGWRQPLGRRWFLSAGADARLRLRPEILAVESVGPVLRLPALWVDPRLAVGWVFF